MTPRLRLVQNLPVPVEPDSGEMPGNAMAGGATRRRHADDDGSDSDRHRDQPFGPLVENRTARSRVRERRYDGAQAWGVATAAESADAAGSDLGGVTGAAGVDEVASDDEAEAASAAAPS